MATPLVIGGISLRHFSTDPRRVIPMATRTQLRAIQPTDEPPKPVRAKTITEAADSGTTRELLVAMRARIAKAVEDPNTPARDLAALTKRLVEVVRDIEAIDARAEDDRKEGEHVADGDFDASAV